MIELTPPRDKAPFKSFRLHSGLTVHPDFSKGGSVSVQEEADAQALEQEGWKRTAASRQAKAVETSLLRKAYTGQMMRETGHTMMPSSTTGRPPRDSDLLRRGLAAQMQREPHSMGDPDPDRRRELGEIEINLDSGPRRIRVAHDPENKAIHLHGVGVLASELDPAWVRGFESTASYFNEVQGQEEMETARMLLGALIDRAMRRHKWLADAVVRQLDNERYGV